MKRRAFLGTIAATTFAGCSGYVGGGVDDGGGTTTGNTTTTGETTTAGDGMFNYQLDDVRTDDQPVEKVTIDVTVEQNFTMDHPAVLRIAFTNTADEAREFGFGSLVPWDGLWGEHQDGTSSLLLAPGDSVVPEAPDDDCWQATDGIALPAVVRTETLDPGETVTGEFNVLATHGSEACLQTGSYRFGDENYLNEGWGFDVVVGAIVEEENN
jgi:hypothetical protein